MEPSFARKPVLIVLGALMLVIVLLAAAYAVPALADPPPSEPGVPAAAIRWQDFGGRDLVLQSINADLAADQAQPSAAPAATGIYGHVNSNGVAAAGVSLELRQYNSSTETVVATTQTDGSGNYAFTNAPTLPAGYRFFVLFGPNGTDPSRVYVWLGPDITSFTAGGSVPGGNFDIGDVKMQAPAHGVTLPLSIPFSWTMRNVPADEYWLHLGLAGNNDLYWNSDSVGHGSSYTLTTLPPGFSYGQQYLWYPVVYTPGGGLGLPYYLRYITFAQTTPGTVKRSYLPALMQEPTLTPSPTPTATPTVPVNLCDPYEPNDHVLAAWGPLASNQEIQAKFCKNDIEDNYYVEAPSTAQPLVVTVRLPGKLVSHTDLWIYHSSDIRNPIAGCGRGPIASGNEVITCPITQTGRYIIRMYTHDSRVYYDETQFYTLKATFATGQSSSPTPTPTATLTPTATPTQPLSGSVTLTSVADAVVFEGFPTANISTTGDMWVGYDDSLDPDGKIVRSVVKFNLSSVPGGAQVQSAKLRIYYLGYWDYANVYDSIRAYQATGDWSESSVNWNNKPNAGQGYGSVNVASNSNWAWFELDVKDLVQNWLNGSMANYGIVLRGQEESGSNSSWRSFSTREGPNPPQLVVNYGAAVAAQAPHTGQAGSIGPRLRDFLTHDGPAADQTGRQYQTLLR